MVALNSHLEQLALSLHSPRELGRRSRVPLGQVRLSLGLIRHHLVRRRSHQMPVPMRLRNWHRLQVDFEIIKFELYGLTIYSSNEVLVYFELTAGLIFNEWIDCRRFFVLIDLVVNKLSPLYLSQWNTWLLFSFDSWIVLSNCTVILVIWFGHDWEFVFLFLSTFSESQASDFYLRRAWIF